MPPLLVDANDDMFEATDDIILEDIREEQNLDSQETMDPLQTPALRFSSISKTASTIARYVQNDKVKSASVLSALDRLLSRLQNGLSVDISFPTTLASHRAATLNQPICGTSKTNTHGRIQK